MGTSHKHCQPEASGKRRGVYGHYQEDETLRGQRHLCQKDVPDGDDESIGSG